MEAQMDREELRLARLARLESLQDKSRVQSKPCQEPLKREAVQEIERVLILEWCDEKHNSAITLVSRAERLIQILSNAIEGSEHKYRRLKFNNRVVQREILSHPPSEKLLRAVGWTYLVESNERFLVWTHAKGSREEQLAGKLIERLKDVQRKERARADRKKRSKIETQYQLQRARDLLDDDHQERKERERRLPTTQNLGENDHPVPHV